MPDAPIDLDAAEALCGTKWEDTVDVRAVIAECRRLRAETLLARSERDQAIGFATGVEEQGDRNRAEVVRLRAEIDRLARVDAWRCAGCGCAFPGHPGDPATDGCEYCSKCVECGALGTYLDAARAERDALLRWSIRHGGGAFGRHEPGPANGYTAWWARGDNGIVHAATAEEAVCKAAGIPESPDALSPEAAEMVAGLKAFCDTLEAGVPIEERFRVDTVASWVCVTDRLPTTYGRYLVYAPPGSPFIALNVVMPTVAVYDPGEKAWHGLGWSNCRAVTHWTLLPEPPSEKEGGPP